MIHRHRGVCGSRPRRGRCVGSGSWLRIWLGTQPGLVAELARAELADIMALTEQIKALEKRIAARVREAPDAMQGDVQLPIPRPGHL